MKSCSKNRKLIAWLALDALDACQADKLRAHMKTCGPCRRYLAELAAVKNKLSAAEVIPDAEASESFHRRLVARLEAEQPASLWDMLAGQLAAMRLTWRVALSAGAVAALIIGASIVLVRQPEVARPPQLGVETPRPLPPERDLSPTASNYQQAANRSLEELDELLTAQARKPRSPAPIYTASILAAGDALY
jgi:hypothetical protein